MARDNRVNSGVPRPFSSTTLPTPSRVFEKIVAPFHIWEVLLAVAVFAAIGVLWLINVTGFEYSSTLVSVGGFGAVSAVSLGIWTESHGDIRQVPSIQNVSRTVDYVRAASRLSVLTVVAGALTTAVVLIFHLGDFFIIDDSTRFAVVAMVGIAFLGSYVIVRTLCSYTPSHNQTQLSLPVEISSIPEIVTALGFVISPLLVVYAGVIYNGQPIVTLPFSMTVVDTFVMLVAFLLLYVAAVSRL